MFISNLPIDTQACEANTGSEKNALSRRLGGAADRDRQTRMKRSGKDERPSARPNHAQAGSGWRETKWPRSENSTGEWPDHRSSRFQRPRVRAWPHGWAGSPFHARQCAMWRCVQPEGARQMGAQNPPHSPKWGPATGKNR